MKYKVNFFTNLLLFVGSLLLTLDFYFTLKLGYSIGYSTPIRGWSKFVKHALWLELIVIFVLLLLLIMCLILFNTKKQKLRERLVKIFLVDWDNFLLFINPYSLIIIDSVVLYKILIEHLLGRY